MPIQARNYDPAQRYGAEIDTSNIAAGEIVTADIADSGVTGVKLATRLGYFTVSKNMALASSEQSLFGSTGLGVASTITGIYATGLDTTATSINLVADQASVATVNLTGEDNTVGAMVGPSAALAATAVAANAHVYLQSTAQADALVTVTFEI